MTPDLYSGTSGVAWFLGELFQSTRDLSIRRVCQGAIMHAINQIESLPRSGRFSLYLGRLGVALSAVHLGVVLDNTDLSTRGNNLALDCIQTGATDGEPDLLAGKAGAVLGLSALAEVTQERVYRDVAERLGHELCNSAEAGARGCSWRSPAAPRERNLTGFSHGAAGVAYSLAELFDLTHEDIFRKIAEQAFSYERSWFDPAVDNWPVFIGVARESQIGETFSYGTSWCHGAPGVAVSRLHALRIWGGRGPREEALAALGTTARSTEAMPDTGAERFSLCHGVTGNAEILILGRQTLGQDFGPNASAAIDALKRRIVRNVDHATSSVHDFSTDEPPGLMCGLAGIGYFCLRQVSPGVPSVLAVRGREFADLPRRSGLPREFKVDTQ